jgi:aminoglycoside phosphotransferase family enzyme
MTDYIRDLSNPTTYAEKNDKIEVIHTHSSTVFLGDKFVYKVKKPVNFGFLDFSTIEKRHYFCKKEIELNEPLAKDVYIGVYPITYDGKSYHIDGLGKIVDYAIKMRRLPETQLLKTKFLKNQFYPRDVVRVADAISDFHKKSCRSKKIDEYGKVKSVKYNTDENFIQMEKFIDKTISKKQYNNLKNWTNHFFEKNMNLFKERIENGKIRDCHGDLHMEHIYLTDPIIIYDCIEFNKRFRCSDIFADIAFLLMDLEYNNGEKISDHLCKIYLSKMSEDDDKYLPLIDFYKVYRAYVRGKVISFMLNDVNIDIKKKEIAVEEAKKYFNLAISYIRR